MRLLKDIPVSEDAISDERWRDLLRACEESKRNPDLPIDVDWSWHRGSPVERLNYRELRALLLLRGAPTT